MRRPAVPFPILMSGFFLLTSCDRGQEKPAAEVPSGAPQWVTIGTDEATGLFHVTGLSIAKVAGRKVRFVPITKVRRILLKFPCCMQTRIPVQFYPGAANTEDVETMGYKVSLVASARVPKDLVSGVLGEVFDNIERLRALHPAYRYLTKEDMTEGVYRMIHRGAL